MVEQPKTPPNEAPNRQRGETVEPDAATLAAGGSFRVPGSDDGDQPAGAGGTVRGAVCIRFAWCKRSGDDCPMRREWASDLDPNNPWPQPYTRETSLFNPVFTSPTLSPSPDGPTLLLVLQDSAYNEVAKYVVAALLNSAGPSPLVPTSILSLATIQQIWTESTGGVGSFSPSPGASWGAAEIVEYLKSTMTSL